MVWMRPETTFCTAFEDWKAVAPKLDKTIPVHLSETEMTTLLDGIDSRTPLGRRDRAMFELFYASLPIAGVDGTIRTRMKGTPAEGNVHAKTGTLSMVRSLSGYVRTADGRLLEFGTLCNNWTVAQADVDRVADAIAVSLARLRLR